MTGPEGGRALGLNCFVIDDKKIIFGFDACRHSAGSQCLLVSGCEPGRGVEVGGLLRATCAFFHNSVG